jgi:hypothetical protein
MGFAGFESPSLRHLDLQWFCGSSGNIQWQQIHRYSGLFVDVIQAMSLRFHAIECRPDCWRDGKGRPEPTSFRVLTNSSGETSRKWLNIKSDGTRDRQKLIDFGGNASTAPFHPF